MKVMLLSNTELSAEFCLRLVETGASQTLPKFNDRAAIALTAIRTCYSHIPPSEILINEGEKYFGDKASEANRLFKHIVNSGHTSTLEHVYYTFAVEDVSRALLAQLTRHRHLSFSVQSQRYVRFGSSDKSGGFRYVKPPSLQGKKTYPNKVGDREIDVDQIYEDFMSEVQEMYDRLREAGVTSEDARMILPQATMCNLVLSGNLRSFLDFYHKRKAGSGAQFEITKLAELIKEKITHADPWLKPFFEGGEQNG